MPTVEFAAWRSRRYSRLNLREMERTRPNLTAALPEGWFYKESITLLHDQGLANVIFSSEPLAPGITTEEYATTQGSLLREEFPGYSERTFEPATVLGGRPGFLRAFEWDPPDGKRVAQMQIYYAENGRGYTATATATLTDFAVLEDVLSDALYGLALAEEPVPASAAG